MDQKRVPRAGAIDQGFWAPPNLPQLEIRTTRDSRQPYAAHFHHTLSLGLILRGETVFTCGGRARQVQAGDLVLIEPGAVHSCNPVQGRPRSYHMLYLDPAWCLKTAGWPASGRLEIKGQALAVRDPDLFAAWLAVTQAACLNRPEVEAELAKLTAEILQTHGRPGDFYDDSATGGPALSHARQLLDRQIRSPLKIKELAARVGLRREYFIRAFRRRIGLTPGLYHHCTRLLEAERLLRRGHDIVSAALATGYADQSHFHRMFVKYFSATPRQYGRNRSLSSKN